MRYFLEWLWKKVFLCEHATLFTSLEVPFRCFNIVPVEPVLESQAPLHFRIALLCGFAPPPHRLCLVFDNAPAGIVSVAEFVLFLCVPQLRRLPQIGYVFGLALSLGLS